MVNGDLTDCERAFALVYDCREKSSHGFDEFCYRFATIRGNLH